MNDTILIFHNVLQCFFFYLLQIISVFAPIYSLFTKYWWIIFLYFLWIYLDRKTCERGGRPWNWYRRKNPLSKCRQYYPNTIKFVDLKAIKPNRNYLFCSFPHGVMSTAFSNWFMATDKFNEVFPYHKYFLVTLSNAFYFPFYREFLLINGAISSSAESINYVLSQKEGGNIVGLVPGGAEESFYCHPGVYKTIVRKRKGFVKVALKNGTNLVPCIAFGEVNIFKQITGPKIIAYQKFVKKYLNFVPLIFKGKYGLPFWHFRKPLTVVGKKVSLSLLKFRF